MTPIFTPSNWFWLVGADTARWFSSAANAYVAVLPPGITPTKIDSEQSLWDALAAAGLPLPAGAATSDAAKTARISDTDMVQLQILFNHENRIRILEGKAAITVAQFKTGVKALLP
jgi:hypothetical protein